MEAVKNYSKLANKLYNAYASWLRDYVEHGPRHPGKGKTAVDILDKSVYQRLSPANFFWTNPSVVQKFLQTKGESLIKGL